MNDRIYMNFESLDSVSHSCHSCASQVRIYLHIFDHSCEVPRTDKLQLVLGDALTRENRAVHAQHKT